MAKAVLMPGGLAAQFLCSSANKRMHPRLEMRTLRKAVAATH
jgi:hypothetical protein